MARPAARFGHARAFFGVRPGFHVSLEPRTNFAIDTYVEMQSKRRSSRSTQPYRLVIPDLSFFSTLWPCDSFPTFLKSPYHHKYILQAPMSRNVVWFCPEQETQRRCSRGPAARSDRVGRRSGVYGRM